MDNLSSRRRFLRHLGLAAGALSVGSVLPSQAQETKVKALSKTCALPSNTPARAAGSQYLGDFKAPKLDRVRLAFVGVGDRGFSHVETMRNFPLVDIVGICDLYQDLADRSVNSVTKVGKKAPATYCNGNQDYKRMITELKPDAVLISPDWSTHAEVALFAMEHGAHAYIEVPMATSMDELWKLVDTAERTKKHCMMMENVNYGREELMFLNMVQQGVIGDLLHAKAGYTHDLRYQLGDVERGTGSWRNLHWAKRDGNLYSTHGVGPVSQYMNCGRSEDIFRRLTSFSSPAIGRAAYAKKNFPADHKWNKLDYVGGDNNVSLIKTNLGRTIFVEWDECSPVPYDRHNLIQGTLGILAGHSFWDGDTTRVAGEKIGDGNFHKWITGDEMKAIYEKYEHPLWKRMGEEAIRSGGHGGMDYIMLARIVEGLTQGQAMDQNVYEGAFWTAITPLSERSVAEDGAPQDFPDFTRGDWKTTPKMPIIA